MSTTNHNQAATYGSRAFLGQAGTAWVASLAENTSARPDNHGLHLHMADKEQDDAGAASASVAMACGAVGKDSHALAAYKEGSAASAASAAWVAWVAETD